MATPTDDVRAHPELYRVGRGEQGVLTVEPYKGDLLPLWRFRTPDVARESATALRGAFDGYLAARAANPALTFREHLRTVGGEIEV